MNAATVSGPRSAIASLILLDGDERFTIAAPEKNLGEVAGRHFCELALRFGRVGNRPAVHGQDHIALTDRGRRGTVLVDIGHNSTRSTRREREAARKLRREILKRQAEPAAGFF